MIHIKRSRDCFPGWGSDDGNAAGFFFFLQQYNQLLMVGGRKKKKKKQPGKSDDHQRGNGTEKNVLCGVFRALETDGLDDL